MRTVTPTCGDARIAELFSSLTDAGMTGDAFDRGEPMLEKEANGGVRRVTTGAGDGKASCGEILEAALTRPDLSSTFFEGLTGRPIPWALDDFNPKTEDDAKIRIRSDAFIALAKKKLAAQGLAEESELFRKRLATAIYAFAQAPTKGDAALAQKMRPYLLFQVYDDLRGFGLRELVADIKANGGLGLSLFPADAVGEATALEALRTDRGVCTERSKVLFALLARAGLDPFFLQMSARSMREAWFERFGTNRPAPISAEDFTVGHVAVGLMVGGAWMTLEPNEIDLGMPYEGRATIISLRELYQMDLTNLAIGSLSGRNTATAALALDGAEALGSTPWDGLILYARAMQLIIQGQIGAGTQALEQSAAANPALPITAMERCQRAILQQRWNVAEKICDDIPADSLQGADALYQLALHHNDYAAARQHLEARMGRGGNVQGTLLELTRIAMLQEKPEDAEDYAQRALRLDPLSHDAYTLLADLLLKRGKQQEADDVIRRLLAVNPAFPGAILATAKHHLAQGKKDQARAYFRRAVKIIAEGKALPYVWYGGMAELADKLAEWPLVAKAMADANPGKVSSITIGLLMVDSMSRTKSPVAAKDAPNLYQAIATFMARPNGEVPPKAYWHLAGIAKRTGTEKELAAMTRQLQQVPEFYAYDLHASLATGDKDYAAERLASWTGFVDTTAMNTKPSDWTPQKALFLDRIAVAIGEFPKDFIRKDPYRADFLRFFNIFGQACEVFEQWVAAENAYETALLLGAGADIKKRLGEVQAKIPAAGSGR